MTTIVHIGDFHAAPGPRNADRYQTLDQIVSEGLALPRLGAWVWPGDLFDGLSTIDDRNAIDARLKRMAAAAPVLIIEGNHDKSGDLRGFANLSGAWPIIVVDEQPQTVRLQLATGEWASIFCLPYPHKHGLVGAGVAHGDIVETAGHLLDPMFIAAAAELEAARAAGDVTAFFFHANVAGAITSAGQPNVGKEIELTQLLLERLGPIYKGGNHIHRPQEISGAWFAGSTARKDYGEVEEKRYLLVHYERGPICESCGDRATCFGEYETCDGAERYSCDHCCGHGNENGWCKPVSEGGIAGAPRAWFYTVESRSLSIPPMYLVEGSLDRDGFELSDDATNDVKLRFASDDWDGCDVRVQYAYLASERSVIDDGLVRRLFAPALRLKVQGIVVPDRELRSVKVTSAKTLPEKLAAMRGDGVLPPTVAEKVATLQQQDRESVLALVRARLAAIETPERATVAA